MECRSEQGDLETELEATWDKIVAKAEELDVASASAVPSVALYVFVDIRCTHPLTRRSIGHRSSFNPLVTPCDHE